MANLKEIRNRISSVKSTQQITKAMKMVAAAKLKKAQDAIIKIRPYAHKLNEAIIELSQGLEDMSQNPFYKVREVHKVLFVVATSDKGLCGSFNTALIRETQHRIEELGNEHKNVHVELICIGRKAADFFKKRNYTVIEKHIEMSSNVSYKRVEEIAAKVLRSFENAEYDQVYFAYNAFKNAAVYLTQVQQYLPILPGENDDESEETSLSNINFIFEPDEETIINSLIPMSLKIIFYRNILESNAAEHGARMTAMDKASENANEIINDLKLFYNKARQAAITKEILEIVGGTTK